MIPKGKDTRFIFWVIECFWLGYKEVANNTRKFASGVYLVYICIKTKYYGKTKYIVHKTK